MTTQAKQSITDAAAEVLEGAGFTQFAQDVRAGKTSPQAAIYYCSRLGHPGPKIKAIFARAQKLVGLPTLDVRHYCETGKKRYV